MVENFRQEELMTISKQPRKKTQGKLEKQDKFPSIRPQHKDQLL